MRTSQIVYQGSHIFLIYGIVCALLFCMINRTFLNRDTIFFTSTPNSTQLIRLSGNIFFGGSITAPEIYQNTTKIYTFDSPPNNTTNLINFLTKDQFTELEYHNKYVHDRSIYSIQPIHLMSGSEIVANLNSFQKLNINPHDRSIKKISNGYRIMKEGGLYTISVESPKKYNFTVMFNQTVYDLSSYNYTCYADCDVKSKYAVVRTIIDQPLTTSIKLIVQFDKSKKATRITYEFFGILYVPPFLIFLTLILCR